MVPGSLSTGGVVSPTSTANVVVAERLPCLSVAAQVTSVLPSGNSEPDGRSQVIGIDPSTMSLALQPSYLTIAPEPELVPTFRSFILHGSGGVVSTTRTVNSA